MSNYSEKSAGETTHRRSSSTTRRRSRSPPLKRYKSPQRSSKHSRSRSRSPQKSRSPNYYPLRRHTGRPMNNRYRSRSRSRSPLSNGHHHHHSRPAPFKPRVENNAPENNVLAVFGLSKRVIEDDLFDLYKSLGCKECKVIMDKYTGCPKGYGFVYFSRTRDATLAREKTDGKLLFGKPLRVDFSIGEREYPAPPPNRNGFKDIRDSRDLRDSRPGSGRYMESHQQRDHRMPREQFHHHNMRPHYVREASPPPRDRYSPMDMIRDRHSYKNFSSSQLSSSHNHHQSHRHEIDRRRVVTPPLPNNHNLPERSVYLSQQRSRSRTPDRPRKHHNGHSRHDMNNDFSPPQRH